MNETDPADSTNSTVCTEIEPNPDVSGLGVSQA